MKRAIILIALLSGLNFAQVLGPRISLSEKRFDFGKIKQGEIVKHDFRITNTGDDLLIINYIRASCGCTAAKPAKTDLKPNESTMLHVEFNSAHKIGKQIKRVYILTNDKKNPQTTILITGEVFKNGSSKNLTANAARIQFEKLYFDFGTIPEGKVVGTTVKFKNTGSGVLRIKDIETSCGCTAALISKKVLKPGEEGKIRIEFDSTHKQGKIARTVTVYSNDEQNSRSVITIFANVVKKGNK